MTRRRLLLLAALAMVTAFAACDLNPQPLPPLDPDNQASANKDAGTGFGDRAEAGLPSDGEEEPSADSGVGGFDAGPDDGGSTDTGDADAGEAGGDDAG
jgi:hypothetical protein